MCEKERDLENEGVREGNMNSEMKNMLYYPPRYVPAEGDDTSSESRSLMQPLRMHDYIPLSELGVNDMSSKSWRINLEKSFVPSSCPK